MGNEQQFPVLKSAVSLTHSSTLTSSLHGLCLSIVAIVSMATRGLCHLNINICCSGAPNEMESRGQNKNYWDTKLKA